MSVSPEHAVSPAVLAAATTGDEEAIRVLWRAWNPALLRFFRIRRALEPNDLAQQVWLEVARKIDAFSGDPEAFRRWLFTLAYRRLIDGARADKRRPVMEELSDATPSGSRFEDEVDGLSWALSVLALLPEKQATAVSLRILVGMTVPDVAAVMGERDATVRVMTHRGLRRLRRLLGETEEQGSTREHVASESSRGRVTQRPTGSLTQIT